MTTTLIYLCYETMKNNLTNAIDQTGFDFLVYYLVIKKANAFQSVWGKGPF